MTRLQIDDPDETIQCCASCGYPAPVTEFSHIYPGDLASRGKLGWLCILCSYTMAGVRVRNRREDADTLAAICFVGNAILDQLGAFKDAPIQWKAEEAEE